MAKKETAEEKCRKYSRSNKFQCVCNLILMLVGIYYSFNGVEWARYVAIGFLVLAILAFRRSRRDEYYYLVRKIEENEKNKEAAKIKRLKNNAAILAEKQKANEK